MANSVEISIIAVDSASNILKKIAGNFGALGAVAVAAIGVATKTAEQAVEATMKWEDTLDNLQDKMGSTASESAAYAYAAKVAGVQVDTFARSNVILMKGLTTAQGKLDTTGKSLEKWGVKVKDASGKVKTMATLTSDIAKKFGELGTAQERVNFLTEIYGRQGAELIDFFDVLNGEGGVDPLAKKMENLGLAMDPARFENFNRNMERLRMVVLATQVAFTEKLMPVLESVLAWSSDFAAADTAGRVKMIQEAMTKFDLPQLTSQFKDWVASVDWGAISQKFADGMNQVDWAGITKAALDSGVNIEQAMLDIIQRTDWASLSSALGVAFTGVVRDGIGGALVNAWIPAAEQFWLLIDNLKYGLIQRFEDMRGAIAGAASNIVSSVIGAFSSLPGRVVGYANSMADQLEDVFKAIEAMVVQRFFNMVQKGAATILAGIGAVVDAAHALMAAVQAAVHDVYFTVYGTVEITQTMNAVTKAMNPGHYGGGGGGKKKAAGGPASGITLVGEQGPELVSLPAGSYVHNNADTRGMLSGWQGVTVNLTYAPMISLATRQEAEEVLLPIIRSSLRQLKGQAV